MWNLILNGDTCSTVAVLHGCIMIYTNYFMVKVYSAPIGLYGITEIVAQLVSIDPNTAQTTNIGPGIPTDYVAQGLASIDDNLGVYYLVQFNVIHIKIHSDCYKYSK